MEKYILAIDQGTTSSRAIIFNQESETIVSDQMEVGLTYRESGWVEQNASEIWETVYETVKECLISKKVDIKNIKAIGIANQRETTILWDKITGQPVYDAIVWQSRQSSEICDKLIDSGYEEMIKSKTGLIINPYFSATKIKWIFEKYPEIYKRALNGEILFGTVDSFLVWKLTEGKVHVTDYTNASRTMLFNIYTLKWDTEILNLLGIPRSILPKVVGNSEIYGYATALKSINKDLNIPIASLVGDQQASLFGQCCFDLGDVKNTYGTGCFMLINTKEKAVNSRNGLLTTIASGINDQIEYALEGSVFVGGSAVQWLRDGMRMIEKSKDVEIYSNRTEETNGVYIVPAFVGLGTPYWDDDARGAVFGLTRATKKEHFINATVQSIAYQSKDVMEVMMMDARIPIRSLAVDGGAASNDYLIQFQADLLNCKILRPECLETTALGAAYLAGLAVKVWESKDELRKLQKINKVFLSRMKKEERDKLYSGWKKAVEATRLFK